LMAYPNRLDVVGRTGSRKHRPQNVHHGALLPVPACAPPSVSLLRGRERDGRRRARGRDQRRALEKSFRWRLGDSRAYDRRGEATIYDYRRRSARLHGPRPRRDGPLGPVGRAPAAALG
jgi:hypothetical protein